MSLHFIITFAPVVIANNEPKALKNPRGKKRTIYIYKITTAQNKPRRVRGSSTFSSFSPLAVQEPLRLPIHPTSVHVSPPRTHLIKHILQPFLRQRRTLYILSPAQLSRQPLPLLLRYQPAPPPSPSPATTTHHPLHLLWIIPQIDLRPHYQARRPGAMMRDFVKPFFTHILKRSGGSDREADEEDVCLRVR